jgi:hypothetical protein
MTEVLTSIVSVLQADKDLKLEPYLTDRVVNCHLMDTFRSLNHEKLEQLHPSIVVHTNCTPHDCNSGDPLDIMCKEIGTNDSEISNNENQPTTILEEIGTDDSEISNNENQPNYQVG